MNIDMNVSLRLSPTKRLATPFEGRDEIRSILALTSRPRSLDTRYRSLLAIPLAFAAADYWDNFGRTPLDPFTHNNLSTAHFFDCKYRYPTQYQSLRDGSAREYSHIVLFKKENSESIFSRN